MEKRAIRRVVSLGVLLALLISVLPLLQLNIGQAEATSPISVRLNSLSQVDATSLSDAVTKSSLGASRISSIDVISGVLTGSDLAGITDMSSLSEITIRTLQPPPTIANSAIFSTAPTARSIKVLSSVVDQYKNANDGTVGDNSWYGFNIISVDENTMNPDGNTPISDRSIAEVKLDAYFPKNTTSPQAPAKTSSFDKYSVKSVLWSTSDNRAVSKFEDGKDYKLLVELTAESGYQFTAGAQLLLNDKNHYSPREKALNVRIDMPTVASKATTNDTIHYTINFSQTALAAATPVPTAADSLTITLSSPLINTIPAFATLPAGMAANVTTVWHDMGGNGIVTFPSAFSDSDTYAVFLNVSANTIGDPLFNGYTNVIINDTAPQPPQFKYEVKNFVVSADKDRVSIELKYTRNKVFITDSNAQVSIASPVGGIAATTAVSNTPAQFSVVSTHWYDTTSTPTEIPLGTLFPYEGKYEAKVKVAAIFPYFFQPTSKITAISSNGSPQYLQQTAIINNISSDGTTAEITIPYVKSTGTCTHSSLIVTGPRVPIPPFESGLTTNAIEATIGNSVELVITKVSCGSCHADITADALFSWRRVNREVPNSPYEQLTTREKGKNIYKIETVSSTDDVYDYYANVTLSASVDGQNSDYVFLKIGDITMPDPYFRPTTVTGDIGVDLVLRVLSGLPDPQPTRMKYEWRKGELPRDGLPTGSVIHTAYNDATFTIRSMKALDEGYYNVTVTNEMNGKAKAASVLVKTRVSPADLIPINQKDIYALDFTAPVTGEAPKILEASADANYTIEHKWRNATSIVAAPTKFESGKTYIADVIIRPKTGYRMGEVGASYLEIDVVNNYLSKQFKEMGPDGEYCRLEVKFNKTTNPKKMDQAKLSYVTTLPEKKTYGDTDFVVAVTGGSGDGEITFTSSDEKVLRVAGSSGGTAVISVVGGGEAMITATKAGGRDDENFYNPATVASTKVTVKPKVLVVKAVDKTIKAGTTTEVFPVDISGFVRGDTQYNLKDFVAPTAKATYPTLPAEDTTTTNKTTNKKTDTTPKTPEQIAAEEQAKLDKLCGEFEIIPSGGTPTGAYVFRYVTGVLTVNKTGVQQSPLPNQNYLKNDSYQIEDRKNGISLYDIEQGGYFVAGTELCVENVTYQLTAEEKALYNANINAAMNGKEIAQIYDITLKLDGSPIQPKGDVLVDIAVANSLKGRYSDLQVAYISDYGDVTIMPHSLATQKISFLTDHFSKYAIIGVARTGVTAPPGSGTDVPQTSDVSLVVLWSAMLMVGISGITVYKLKVKGKTE